MTSFTPSRRPVRYVVGIDIGGTNIVAGTVAEDGSELLGLVSEPTFSEQGADAVMTRIVKLTRASMAAARGKEIAGVGIGSPGPLDAGLGVERTGRTDADARDLLAARRRHRRARQLHDPRHHGVGALLGEGRLRDETEELRAVFGHGARDDVRSADVNPDDVAHRSPRWREGRHPP